MSLELLFLYVVTEVLFCISPGPAVAMSLSAAVIGRWRLALAVIAGINVGNGIFFIISAVILWASFSYTDTLFYWFKYIGAAYLFYFIIDQAIRAKKQDDPAPPPANRFFLGAVMMQVANPQTILFFLAFLPQFIDPDIPLAFQFMVLASLTFITETIVLSIYVWLVLRVRDRATHLMPKAAIRWAGYATMVVAVVWSFVRN
ncbi:MAG: LysE family translocator [Pseudomonadota bacterium]